jgi:hypothetical protein
MIDWDAEFEAQAKEMAQRNDAVDPAKIRAKSEAEFQRGVALGWWDADGNALLPDDETDDDE